MEPHVEDTAKLFLEIASEQRLAIIYNLSEKKYTISEMAKKLDATVPEVHRNFNRLSNTKIIQKTLDNGYSLTVFGTVILAQIPSYRFVHHNNDFFDEHNLGSLPSKFVQRLGDLMSSELVNGYVKVSELWLDIYKNASKYVCNVLTEASYDPHILDILNKNLENKIPLRSIFSDSTVVTKDRKENIEKFDFEKFLEKDLLKRKMHKNTDIVVVLNEKEAGLCLPLPSGQPDLSKMFYSDDENFHDWCLDYFDYLWENSSSFQESKLR